MKTIITAFLLLFTGNNLVAQTFMVDSISIDPTPKAKFLFETEKGLVYALPQDNMRCLVPTNKSDMPVASSQRPGYIPNPLLNKGHNPIITIPLKNSPLTFEQKINLPNSQIINLFPDKK